MNPTPTVPSAATPDAPHLQDLTDLQAAYVVHYVANGGKAKKAYIAAGGAVSSAHVGAAKLNRNPKVLKAIYEESVAQLARAVPGALAAQVRLSTAGKSEMVRHLAAKDVLDRAGFSAPKRVDVSGGFSIQIDLS